MKRKNRLRVRRLAALLLTLLLAAAFLTPLGASAQDTKKVVRVGWYESPFNQTDELGRRTGYGYDYQQRIAAYTGWTYEYVEVSLPVISLLFSVTTYISTFVCGAAPVSSLIALTALMISITVPTSALSFL